MIRIFNTFFEFDRKKVDKIIIDSIFSHSKGYVCVVDGNVLNNANIDSNYNSIINSSIVNICDGSSIALLANLIHNKRFKTYTGPEIFEKFVNEDFKQFFLGNTTENLTLLKEKFVESGINVEKFQFESLPFLNVKDFNYKLIGDRINEFSPDIIWVSLGAPKQEMFINSLLPFIEKGVLIAIGAAFNLFLGENSNKRAPFLIRKLNLEWLFRVIQEPKRVGKRAYSYLKILPRLVFDEIKYVKFKN